jgi:tRNA(His) guanylyltransferase
MNFDSLGDECKWFESNFSVENLIPTLPVIIRLDGNNFHNYTKGLQRPFDEQLSELMIETTKELVKETGAVIGYTQSDEITLILHNPDPSKQFYQGGKKFKILSKLTGFAVNFFNIKRLELLPNHNKIANFDCRVYQVPNLYYAYKQLLWRELDATKNSISVLAHSNFSHKSLQNLHRNQLMDKLMLEKNINWNDLETKYKRGSYVKKVKDSSSEKYTPEELALLPEKHHARLNPYTFKKIRGVIQVIDMPIISTLESQFETIFTQIDLE